jgi:hypothetical protein
LTLWFSAIVAAKRIIPQGVENFTGGMGIG